MAPVGGSWKVLKSRKIQLLILQALKSHELGLKCWSREEVMKLFLECGSEIKASH